ncbi:MAG: hypothetical protein NTX45_23995 [Proteobacteria bacterium]|nr:hypothetical protein [Pseudomonadota bacterium]
MAEQNSLIVHVARQTLTTPAKPTESLVGRGLAAIRNGGTLAKSQDQDALYQKAREIYECYYFEYLCGNNWQESEHTPELTEAFLLFKRLAAEGYCKAYYPLSQLYSGMVQLENAQGLAKHFLEIAFEWCSSNVSREDPDIWEDMGELFEKNSYLNNEYAVFWYTRSAKQGNARAQNNLGSMYRNGRGVEQDDEMAIYWYEKAAKQGDGSAQCNLGSIYESGFWWDNNKAVYWYEQAAEQGHSDAQYLLGSMYFDGRGVEQDNTQAFYWYERAAKQGIVDAQYLLGFMYEFVIEKNYNQAIYWYEKAAEKENARAQCSLGIMYYLGTVVEQDDDQAVFWCEKAAKQEIVAAQCCLGSMYEDGRGVEQDDTQAAYWFEKAATQGDATAQFKLGQRYEEGNGVEQNYEQAVYWYEQAAEQGNATAIKQLNGEADDDTVPFPIGMQDSSGRVISIFRAGIEVPCESIIFIKLNQRETDKYVFNVFYDMCQVAVESKNNQNEIQLKFNIDTYGILHIQAFSAQTGDPLKIEIKKLP